MKIVYEELSKSQIKNKLVDFSEDKASNNNKAKDIFLDTQTNLMWQDDENVKTLKVNWQEAVDYSKKLSLAGCNDWRLPSKKELEDLCKKKEKLKNVIYDYCWSFNTPLYYSGAASSVNFDNCNTGDYPKSSNYYVRCVRGG